MGILSKVRGKDKGGDAEASKGLDEPSLDSPAGDSPPAEGSTVQGGGSDPTDGMELLDLVQDDEDQPAAEDDPEDAEVDDLMDIFATYRPSPGRCSMSTSGLSSRKPQISPTAFESLSVTGKTTPKRSEREVSPQDGADIAYARFEVNGA